MLVPRPLLISNMANYMRSWLKALLRAQMTSQVASLFIFVTKETLLRMLN